MPDPCKAVAFTGWHRRRRENWREVCSADDAATAWRLLLDILPRGGERIVLPAGRTPADRLSTHPETHR